MLSGHGGGRAGHAVRFARARANFAIEQADAAVPGRSLYGHEAHQHIRGRGHGREPTGRSRGRGDPGRRAGGGPGGGACCCRQRGPTGASSRKDSAREGPRKPARFPSKTAPDNARASHPSPSADQGPGWPQGTHDGSPACGAEGSLRRVVPVRSFFPRALTFFAHSRRSPDPPSQLARRSLSRLVWSLAPSPAGSRLSVAARKSAA